jgi:hypothetical protein
MTPNADYVRVIAAFEEMIKALQFYGEPATYHAIGFFPDPPCGEFMQDFSDDHEDPVYDRAMPGKFARAALDAWIEATSPIDSSEP